MGPGIRRDDVSISPRGRKTVRARHPPRIAVARIVGAVEQFARTQRRIKPGEGGDVRRRGALREMDRPQILRMLEAGGGEQFRQRMQRRVVIIIDPVDLVRHYQRAIADRVLGRDAGRAAIAMARAMSKAVAILPEAPTRMRLRIFMPTSALCTKLTPSRIGMPRWSMNSSGAAPVPPSLPSTTMKSG